MRSTSVRLAVGALFLASAAATSGCSRSHVGPAFQSPRGSVAVYRSDVPSQPLSWSVPSHRAAVVAQAPRPAPVIVSGPAPAPVVRVATPLPAGMHMHAVNATCPVMLGNPVDPNVTSVFQGRVVAFSDVGARALWESDPPRYASNLPGFASGTASDASGASSYGASARIVTGPYSSGPQPLALPSPGRSPCAGIAHPAVFPAKRIAAIAAPAPFVGSPDGDEDEDEPAACEGDEECPGGNCRLPGR